ncbi:MULTISPECIES: hypothetical protein [unclassified Paenibacillus]|uniref:hypothetical protein n=1 Tax=unclassified Paenibacillus TaxID=185978 RepID=UPI0009A7EEC0|nr:MULTISPECIES: hypothetical protein [unclassified Paenibacillus]SLJ99231.1 hypothetical protein SAMN06272722_102880 [Paenibacillus sp. RU5A]SOC66637.1 hypothetical protein SAMN05880581_102117 [Paenibacillus sp. RU26A]SOC70328.1 hypothetical protein SAMN05880586_102880 [Paenibacillus sp. RU5M]
MELKVELIPDLRTSGGEVQDIMVGGQYMGSLLLVFREGDRVSGSLQIEQNSLPDETEQYIVEQVHEYIRSLADAVSAAEYEVLVSCGTLYSVLQKPESQTDMFNQSSRSEDTYNHDGQNDRAGVNEVHVIPGSQAESFTYEDPEHLLEMELVSAGRSISTYVFNDANGQELAEASLKQYGADVQGEIHWYDEPAENYQDAAAELLVRELDEEIIDTITIRMWHQGQEMESAEWVHRDFADEDEIESEEDLEEIEAAEEACYVMLVRKDREFRVYELFLQERGGLPVGTATIDTSEADLSGYIDYQVPGTSVQRKSLVEVLMRELDKELEFDTLHLTMLYRNQIIDEAKIEG